MPPDPGAGGRQGSVSACVDATKDHIRGHSQRSHPARQPERRQLSERPRERPAHPDNHLAAARIVANNIDGVLEQNITKLYDISLGGGVDFEDNDWAPEEKALRAGLRLLDFHGGVFILDRAGTCLLTYPYRDRSTDGNARRHDAGHGLRERPVRSSRTCASSSPPAAALCSSSFR